jgi:hypothetical protein
MHGRLVYGSAITVEATLPNVLPDSEVISPAQNWVKMKCPDDGVV